MGNIFANKKPAVEAEVEDDFIGGGNVLDSDIYPAVIKYAYTDKSKSSNAHNLTLCLLVNGNIEITRQIWMTNKDGDVTRINPKTKKEENLRGYNQVNSLCMLVVSKDISKMDVQEKTLNLYDFESKKNIPQTIECLVELHDCELQVAIQKQIVDKNSKNEATGDWEPSGETREINEFIKFYHRNRRVTLSEISKFIKSLGEDLKDVLKSGNLDKAVDKMEEEEGTHATQWLSRNYKETYDRSTGKREGKAFAGGKSSNKKAKASLFDD